MVVVVGGGWDWEIVAFGLYRPTTVGLANVTIRPGGGWIHETHSRQISVVDLLNHLVQLLKSFVLLLLHAVQLGSSAFGFLLIVDGDVLRFTEQIPVVKGEIWLDIGSYVRY